MIQSIKNWSYKRKLQEQREVVPVHSSDSYNPGKKISILYEIDNLDDHSVVKDFKMDCASMGKIVKTLSYFDHKVEVNSLAQKTFTRKDINWDNTPSSPYVEEFIKWESDLLICPVRELKPCFDYIVRLTPARLKVGIGVEGAEDLFDLIVDCKMDQPLNLILNDILTHLKLISAR